MATPALQVLARALDPEVGTPADPTSEKILDAALDLAAASGLRHLTMDDVARRAGVGRMTVYRRFSDRDGLVEALVIRETRRCLAAMDAATDPSAPVADQVAEGFVVSIRLANEHPLLARLVRVEPGFVLDTLNAGQGSAFGAAIAFLTHRLEQSKQAGVLAEDVDVAAVAELLARLAFSFVLVPQSGLPLDDDERLRAIARAHVAPLLNPRPDDA